MKRTPLGQLLRAKPTAAAAPVFRAATPASGGGTRTFSSSGRMRDEARVALIQFHSASEDPNENQARAETFVRQAAHDGKAQFILLPELYRTMLPRERMPHYGEEVPNGPTARRWAGLARELGVWLMAGSMVEPVEDQPGKLYNTAVLFSDKGDMVAKYRKIHLFDICAPGVVEFKESALISAGRQIASADSPFGKLGLSVCYDLRFPELFRELASQGMDILCIPAAFNYGTGQKHWLHLLKARAIENQCFVLAPNQVGTAPNKFRSWGHSLILDPWGDIVAEGGDGEEIVYGTLDLALINKYREALPALKHIRRDLFHV